MTSIALAAYRKENTVVPALMVDGRLIDVGAAIAAGAHGNAAWVVGGWPALLADWDAQLAALKTFAADVVSLVGAGRLESVAGGLEALASPYRPERIFCAASNFVEHANEMGTVLAAKADSKPYMFLKLKNAVLGPNEAIRMPPETSQLDWEVELAAVIGRRARRVSVDQALDHVAGYAVVNDITARDLNKRTDYPFKFDWFQGKAHDTFAPFGPWIVPAWEIPDPQALRLRLTVGGDVMQDDSTAHMIWTVREQIAYLSTIVTLEPGDVIATGTPTGVGASRGVFLKVGDVLTAEVEGVGAITNHVVADAT